MIDSNISKVISVPNFGNIKIDTFLSRPILSIVLIVYLIGYISLGTILFYHWRAYGMKSSSIVFAETAFLFVSLILFVLAGVSISYY